jgi:hypothetical protein
MAATFQRFVSLSTVRIPSVPYGSPRESDEPSKRLGAGTRILTTTRADYTDPLGRASRRLDELEEYCCETAYLIPRLTSGLVPDPADVREWMLLTIPIARAQLRDGILPVDALRDLGSQFEYLALKTAPYTGERLRQKRNFSAQRQRDQLTTERDQWIVWRVRQLISEGIRPTPASKSVESELLERFSVKLTAKQIRNIYNAANIG